MTDKRGDPVYLGDGVYCCNDGYQIWLYTETELGSQQIALDPDTFYALMKYAKKYMAKMENEK
jgi:hypothetical protein